MGMECSQNSQMKIVKGDAGYVLEDVPHLTDYIPDLPVTLFLCFCIFSIPIYYIYFVLIGAGLYGRLIPIHCDPILLTRWLSE